MNKKNDQDKTKKRTSVPENVAQAAVAKDVVQRYGSGVKEHIVGYTGTDNETGITNKRSLKDISNYKRAPKSDPNYKTQTKQQAGFAAESKEVSRRRAEEAIKGQKPHTVRTDDIIGPDGQRHHVNDQLFDITSEVDSKGNPVPHSSAQMKFEGSSPKQAVDKLLAQDHEKYIDNDVKILVPKDYYDGMKQELDDKISSLEKQVDSLKKQGKTDVAAAKQRQLDKCRALRKNLRKSEVSNDEAIEARNNPEVSTSKDIVKVAHRAGLQQAATGAAISGGMSLISNYVAVIKNEKTPEEAAKTVVVDTASGAVVSYTTAFGGAVIKGTMQNSTLETVRNLSKTNLPAYIVTSTIEVGKTLTSFFSGKIDGVECLEQLGEKGYCMVGSALFAAIGQVAIPIPVVGALAGSMIGYALSSASYGILLGSLKNAKLAQEERIRVQQECEEAIRLLRQYRKELEEKIAQYLHNERVFFDDCFSRIQKAFDTGDIDGYISGCNSITEHFGKQPLYRNMDEFEEIMTGDDPISF